MPLDGQAQPGKRLCLHIRQRQGRLPGRLDVFRLPAGPDGREWPAQERFRSLLQENSQPYLYYLFNASGKADELIGTLYAQRPGYRLVARIPSRSGISLVLYRRETGGLPGPR
jgi:hypothetical protein